MAIEQDTSLAIPPPALDVPWPGPPLVHAAGETPLSEWAAARRAWIEDALLTHGAILFKGFAIGDRATFQAASEALCGRLLDYVYRSTPRTTVAERVYTATEYRPSASIPFHNENSYQRTWPMKLAFCCLRPAPVGGETGLASTSRVTRRIDASVLRRFEEKGVMYVRNYHPGADLSWQETFQTQHRQDVEDYCRKTGITYEWRSDDHLQTRQVCQAVAAHPKTGERLWFNQAQLFHLSSLGEEDASMMIELFGADGVPRHAYFGDGSAIDAATLTHIRQAYEAEAFLRPWEAGDVLLVDNMLVAHARSPFEGPREVLVAMGDAYTP
jgi:alpha-ketoglutarate-dependent taurine dioxygenase